jgi:hypothetical protein
MPDGKAPLTDPELGGFDLEADLERVARFIYSNRSGIALNDLDNWFDVNPSELDELDKIIDSLVPPSPSHLNSGIRIFEVTQSSEGEFVDRDGNRYAVVNNYSFNYVPNRPRQTIASWAFYGQRKD